MLCQNVRKDNEKVKYIQFLYKEIQGIVEGD